MAALAGRFATWPTCVLAVPRLFRLLLLLLPPRGPSRRQHHRHQPQHLVRVCPAATRGRTAHCVGSRSCCCPCPHASANPHPAPRELQRKLVVLR